MAPESPVLEARNEFFQKLKPTCIKISQLAIQNLGTVNSSRDLIQLTDHLHKLLTDQVKVRPLSLDEKLAEYVFFPLYHVFRQMDHYPMSLIEICVKCLAILIQRGWKSSITPQLVQQILSLLTFIIDGVPGSLKKRNVPEEVLLESFNALSILFETASTSLNSMSELSQPANIPALGHALTVMIDGATEGETPSIQEGALRTIQVVYRGIKDHQTLATFLPGTLSGITKILSMPSRYKRLVLVETLATAQLVIVAVLGDIRMRSILAKPETIESAQGNENQVLGSQWLDKTSLQVKKAITIIVKLRFHDDPKLQSSLATFCVTLLDQCHLTLSNCNDLLVETAMIVEEETPGTSTLKTSLRDLISIYPELGISARSTVYIWITGLSRLMQSADGTVKSNAIRALSKGIALLKSMNMSVEDVQDTLWTTLRDGVVVSELLTSSKPVQPVQYMHLLEDKNATTVANTAMEYSSLIFSQESQKLVKTEFLILLKNIASWNDQTNIIQKVQENIEESVGDTQVASFWLSFELVKAAQRSSTDFDTFLDTSMLDSDAAEVNIVFDEMYSFSVEVLNSSDGGAERDWRLEAIALEVTAYAAQRAKRTFRPELIDVLFPISTLLGSDNEDLQQRSIITLNTVAVSCGYSSVSALIIDNADYMVDKVAMQLALGDVSPASARVLLMMMRLSGPRLIPYLDDTIDSIFGALSNFHGYPHLVESLFAVLNEAVTQGVRSSALLLEEQKGKSIDHRKKSPKTADLNSLLELIDRRTEQTQRDDEEIEEITPLKGHPTHPWSTEKTDDDESAVQKPEPEKPPNSPTYQLLLRIADLTQHYLTSPIPRLRRTLLELLATASPALAADEEAFLPLINAVWPVLIARLYDSESFVAIQACATLAEICSAAGDFLSSRFKTEWYDGLGAWCRKIKGQTASQHQHHKSSGGVSHDILIPIRSTDGTETLPRSVASSSTSAGSLGLFATPAKLWEAVIQLLTSMVSNVRMDEEIFEEILLLLSEVLENNAAAREALEAVNVDAVWLMRYERGRIEKIPTPQIAGLLFADM